VISILKPGKDPALPSSYRSISLLGTIGKLFEKILLHEVNVGGLMREEQFGFRPNHSTSLQLVHLVERITSNFGVKRLTGAVSLDVAKAFDTVWIDGLLYKLTLLNFWYYIVHTISSYLRGRTFEASFQTTTSTLRGMRAGVAQGELISPVLFSLYVTWQYALLQLLINILPSYITLVLYIYMLPTVKPHCLLYCQFGSADSTVLYTDCVVAFSLYYSL
jgi:hypothetical protein